MKYELWILAIVLAGTGEEPFATVHATHAEALRSIVRDYRNSIESESAYCMETEIKNEAFVRDALAGIVKFTIEPAIIDTAELHES